MVFIAAHSNAITVYKMQAISKTGLLSSVDNSKNLGSNQRTVIEIPKFSCPAPYVLRPFAGVYNPYPYGCSVLCNHPADYEAKDVVRKAKESWVLDGRTPTACDGPRTHRSHTDEPTDRVPEELFRKYTDTDSRPITPAPTVASIVTRSSQVRRCVTPDPVSSQPGKERTLLVLDLRRSHSQETLNWLGAHVPTTVLQPPTRTPSAIGVSSPPANRKVKQKGGKSRSPSARRESVDPDAEASNKLKQQVLSSVKTLTVAEAGEGGATERSGVSSGDEDVVKRRGKKKRGKKGSRDNGREGEREFQGIPDPGETQVSTLGESRGGSTRPSLVPGVAAEPVDQPAATLNPMQQSFLPTDLLKRLQRQLDQEDVESEFDAKRKIALEEAFRTRLPAKLRHQGEELRIVKKELKHMNNSTEKWLTVPRAFSRKCARFELPMDNSRLQNMSCLDYASLFVFPSSERLVLYNQVFNLHREELDEDEQMDRILLGKYIVQCLNEVMGRQLASTETDELLILLGIGPLSSLSFRTFTGVAALCERLLGTPPSKAIDPPHTLELADFRCLQRTLSRLTGNTQLAALLTAIRDS